MARSLFLPLLTQLRFSLPNCQKCFLTALIILLLQFILCSLTRLTNLEGKDHMKVAVLPVFRVYPVHCRNSTMFVE